MSAALHLSEHLTDQRIVQTSIPPADGQYQQITAQRLIAAECTALRWDDGNDAFAPTTLQIRDLHAWEQP